jgi:hypothetical protein
MRSLSTRTPLPSRSPAAEDWHDCLSTDGIAAIEPAFPAARIADWNRRLDPLFAAQVSEDRAYVGADVLVEPGVLGSCLTPAIRAVVMAVTPDAVAYHAHVYEIAANQDRPHIRAGRLDGWHRDEETIRSYHPGRPRHLSLFVYLTDVAAGGGAFELCLEPPGLGVHAGRPTVSASGAAGMAFVWNRSYVHRASPNRSDRRRRVLKMSWQPIGLPNDRINDPELRRARELAGQSDDAWALAWLGGDRPGGLPAVGARPPAPVRFPATGSVRVSRLEAAVERAWSLRHLVLR